VVIEGHQAGAQLTITTEVENFPGFPQGIMGPELVEAMRRQAERFGTRFVCGRIVQVGLARRPFTLELEGGKTIQTQTFIIATGAEARLLGLASERALMGYGVSACATCDGFFFRGKTVMVVGGGDSAVEEACFLTKFATRVTIVHRRDKLRASKIMQQRAFNNPKIDFIWDSAIEEILGVEDKKVRGVRLRNLKTGELCERPIDGVFAAIGHTPNTRFLGDQLELDPAGFIICQEPTSRTSVEGVFACGDVMYPIYRQAITAAGTGCRAAIDAERYLEAHHQQAPREAKAATP
jgi:thioredoxin reductase (NADPH)